MTHFLINERPIFGRIKLIEFDFYTMMLDCTGYAQPMSYCEAVKMLKHLDFKIEERGTGGDKKEFEIWRIPEEINTRKKEIHRETDT